MTELIAQYREAVRTMNNLKSQVLEAFNALPSLEAKLQFVGENGSDFLEHERYYCPHVKVNGVEVSLYDDLYWDRNQTMDLDDVIERMIENLMDDVEVEDDDTAYLIQRYTKELINLNSHWAAIGRDMLSQGIGRATHDW